VTLLYATSTSRLSRFYLNSDYGSAALPNTNGHSVLCEILFFHFPNRDRARSHSQRLLAGEHDAAKRLVPVSFSRGSLLLTCARVFAGNGQACSRIAVAEARHQWSGDEIMAQNEASIPGQRGPTSPPLLAIDLAVAHRASTSQILKYASEGLPSVESSSGRHIVPLGIDILHVTFNNCKRLLRVPKFHCAPS
jgi:hypothetical protein